MFATATLVGMCLTVLPELNRHQQDDPFFYYEMHDTRVTIPSDPRVRRPALVFSTFTLMPGANVHAEPVYNWYAAAIDDNPVIFAHDLGSRNAELLRYYAERQPQRRVYYYDRVTRQVRPGGTVVDELRRLARAGTSANTRPATTQRGPGRL